MDRRTPPRTEEGWYVLHDFRSIDWDAWRGAPDRRRERAIEEGREFLAGCAGPEEGGSATFAVVGHEADLLLLHLRPTVEAVEALERRFERTALAGLTDQVDSYLSVTEVSGYMSEEFFEDDEEADPGTANYIRSRLHPEIPDDDYVSFYPMDKRRGPEDNWYDLPFDERADHLSAHGDIGREYAGRVTQIISGSVGLDDHEWGVTLFSDDPTDIKELLYEMRFDPSSSRFGEFGRFRFGRRLDPDRLGGYLRGEALDAEPGTPHHGSHGSHDGHGGREGHGGGHRGGESDGDHGERNRAGDSGGDGVREALEQAGVYAGQPHGEDVHAVVVYSAADPDELFGEVEGLRSNFDHYDSHVKTAVYEGSDETESAVVSLWETERAASTASGFLSELPEVVRQAGDRTPAGADGERAEPESGEDDSWGTMGMFYAVKPEHRADFVGTFEEVGEVLSGMEGHRKTNLLANREDENDLFIASRWDSREDALAFFRSDEFADTVEWGRDVLADRPRHVFLA